MEENTDGRDSMQIDVPAPAPAPAKQQLNQATQELSSDHLKVYYGKCFPYDDIFRWLSYGNDGKHPACDESFFGRREFSFTLANDIYLRFLSFNSAIELENSIKDKCPHKIDIGPVYSVYPSKRHAYGKEVFTPVERELIFDIDISEYDDVRYCCSGSDICPNCWPLMAIAIKVIDTALRDDFGFDHILWVYSGRRGVHCWVCDSRARRLSNELRSSIADYFHAYKGGENSMKKAYLTGPSFHPFLARTYTDILLNYFERKLIQSQRLFSIEERYNKILDIIPDKSAALEINEKWQGNKRPLNFEEGRWDQLKSTLQYGKHKGLHRCVEEIVFSYTFPRIDMEVSKQINHLLKAPFCVHPKTGRVCIPIDPKRCDNFDPTSVPTLWTVLEELNAGGLRKDSENKWERTSLEQSIRYFRSSFLQPLIKSCKEEMESSYKARIEESNNSSLSW